MKSIIAALVVLAAVPAYAKSACPEGTFYFNKERGCVAPVPNETSLAGRKFLLRQKQKAELKALREKQKAELKALSSK